MVELPDGFDGHPTEPKRVDEDATPAVALSSPEGAQFLVVGSANGYVGCLIQPENVVEGYYQIADADGGLSETLELLLSAGWEQQ